MKIVDYFEMSAPQQAEIINQLEAGKDLWGAIPFIINCLKKEGQSQVSPTDGGFHDLLIPNTEAGTVWGEQTRVLRKKLKKG